MSSFRGRVVPAIAVLILSALRSFAAGPTISIAVDATEAPRKIIHAKLRIPATPGDPHAVLPQVDSRRARPGRPSHRSQRTGILGRRKAFKVAP